MNSYLKAVKLAKSYHGKNGAGKTTTFSLILGLVPQDSGQIFLDGEEITEYPMYLRAQRGVCLLPQEPSAFRKLTVEDNLRAIMETLSEASPQRASTVEKTLKEFGLEKLARAKAFTLSGGERRRLEIARAMVSQPEFILLDEPFTGIDPIAIEELQKIMNSLKEKGLGVLVTDHSVRETLKIVDRAYIIDKGKILKEGTPKELVMSEEVRRSYLGEEFRL
jgi:lipopolysaccharide export system ATP-binding protein